jgi:peptidoglycan/xylan/chitin deacetylase (PgdA/CDA1 family)
VSELQVALTLDAEHPDRPATAGVAEGILELFERLGVVATFFVQGRWAEAYPETARSIVSAGHLVGSHSHYHVRMPLLGDAGLAEDIRVAESVLRDILGVDPRPWFRCPFGAGSNDPRVIAALQAAGYRNVGWDVGVDDWDDRTGDEVERGLVGGVIEHGNGAIVLLHTWPDATLEGLRAAIPRLRDAGATFVRIDALAAVPTLPNWMRESDVEQTSAAPTA